MKGKKMKNPLKIVWIVLGFLCLGLHCLRLVGHTPRVSKRGKDTEWDASRGMEEIHEFCFKDFAAVCLFWNFFVSGIPVILLITPKRDMLIAAVLFL